MQDTSVALIEQSQSKPPRSETRADRLTPRVRTACDAMVWDGLPFNDAAGKAGLTVRAMRLALDRPHVRSYLNKQRQVLRDSEGPRNIHRLVAIRDAADNMPAVNAIKLLEELGDDHSQRGSGVSASPGVTIRVVTVVQQQPVQTFPSDMSLHDVKQINGLTNSDANAASAVDRVTVDAAPAIPASAVRRPPRENP